MDAPYRRLAAVLRERLNDGTYLPGTAFPSVRQIATEHQVGLGAAYQAVAILRADGLLEGSPGRRLTVAHPVEVSILSDADADWPHGRGDAERTTVRADETLANRLQVPARTTLHRERVELLDARGRPAMVSTTWRHGRSRSHTTYGCVLRLDALSAADAALLGLAAGIPTLVVERTRYDGEDAVVQVADLVLPADRWHVSW
jgi:GntR family transcriptional regulator